jgi:hypothetical protein
MTDPEIDELAQGCLRSVATGRLEDGGFSPLVRRGLERLLTQTPGNSLLRPEDVEWSSHRLQDRKLFKDLRAYLHEATVLDRGMVQLTALDREGTVCDFAFMEDITRLDLPYLKDAVGLQRSPWFNVAMFSAHYKIEAMLPECHGVTYGTRRLGNTMYAAIKLSRRHFQTLPAGDAARLLDDLSSIAKNACRLIFDVRPSALHVVLIESQDTPGKLYSYVGAPPKELWLADRLVDISD